MKNIENIILDMVQDFEIKVQEALQKTKYSDEIRPIVDSYKNYLINGVKNSFITRTNINEFKLAEFSFLEGRAYASIAVDSLRIYPRFFIELKDDQQHKNNVLYHELSHMHFSPLCQKVPDNLINFGYYLDNKVGNNDFKFRNACGEVRSFWNEFLSQETAERSSEKIDGNKRQKHKFESKIFTSDINCESNFQTYEDYQELFLSFARTLNGFGKLNDAQIYDKFKEMLENGTIQNHIIGTYQEQNKELDLMNIFILINKVKKAHEEAMGIGVVYLGDKNALTEEVNAMLEYLQSNKNLEDFKEFPVEDYPNPPTRTIKLSFGKPKSPVLTPQKIQEMVVSTSVDKLANAQARVQNDIQSEKTLGDNSAPSIN